jgi:hypothetical protein
MCRHKAGATCHAPSLNLGRSARLRRSGQASVTQNHCDAVHKPGICCPGRTGDCRDPQIVILVSRAVRPLTCHLQNELHLHLVRPTSTSTPCGDCCMTLRISTCGRRYCPRMHPGDGCGKPRKSSVSTTRRPSHLQTASRTPLSRRSQRPACTGRRARPRPRTRSSGIGSVCRLNEHALL